MHNSNNLCSWFFSTHVHSIKHRQTSSNNPIFRPPDTMNRYIPSRMHLPPSPNNPGTAFSHQREILADAFDSLFFPYRRGFESVIKRRSIIGTATALLSLCLAFSPSFALSACSFFHSRAAQTQGSHASAFSVSRFAPYNDCRAGTSRVWDFVCPSFCCYSPRGRAFGLKFFRRTAYVNVHVLYCCCFCACICVGVCI